MTDRLAAVVLVIVSAITGCYGSYYRDDVLQKDAILERIPPLDDTSGRDRSIYSEPGKEFHYTGAGFEYLRYVLQEITGTPFGNYMEQAVLAPLGMVKSSYPATSSGNAAGERM